MARNNMSNDNENNLAEDLPSEEEITDTLSASINFYYDGLTGVPKISIKREDPRFIDPLTVYAMASMSVIEEHYEEIVEKMKEMTDMNQRTLSVH